MSDKNQLRKYVREIILEVKEKQRQQYLEKLTEERHLRSLIKKLLLEVEDETPETTTGMNVLKDVLRIIVPILEDEYGQISTSKEQRDSFRAHIIKSVQNLISTASMYTKQSEGEPDLQSTEEIPAPNEEEAEEETLQEQEGEEETGEVQAPEQDPAFIDVNPKAKVKPEDAFVAIPNVDATGRDMAKKAFVRIQKQILEAYSVLHDPKDRNLFYKYLITNLKLHFDSFEDSLSIKPQEPTTPEYEKEKQRKQSEVEASSEIGGEAPIGEEPLPPEGVPGEEETPPELEAEI
jgi:hypothetical protein